MSEAQIRASLRLWRWRVHRWREKLRVVVDANDPAEAKRLHDLIAKGEKRIDRRLKQLGSYEHGTELWMPGARRLDRQPGFNWQINCPAKGVLHTTEGAGLATGTLDAKRAWPHFEITRDGDIYQYIPLNLPGRALARPGGVSTNGAHAIQTEVDGHASDPNWPDAQKDAVRRMMRFVEENAGVERASHVSFTSPSRLTESAWYALKGWCGHVHVPENDHVDPGPIKIKELL